MRRILSGELFVYYRVDEEEGAAYVFNVLYARGAKWSDIR